VSLRIHATGPRVSSASLVEKPCEKGSEETVASAPLLIRRGGVDCSLNRTRFLGRANLSEIGVMAKGTQFSREVRERTIGLVHEHCDAHVSQWATIGSVAEKIGCATDALRKWIRQGERETGTRVGPSTGEQARVKALERHVNEPPRLFS